MIVSVCAGHGSFPPTDCVPDTVNGVRFVRDLYEMSNDTSGTVSTLCSPEAIKSAQRWCAWEHDPNKLIQCVHMPLLHRAGTQPSIPETSLLPA